MRSVNAPQAKALEDAADSIWAEISSGAAWEDPSLLTRFLVLSFADLKSHRFYYWFAFPAFALSPPPRCSMPAIPLANVLDVHELMKLQDGFDQLTLQGSDGMPAFFAIRRGGGGGGIEVAPLVRWCEWRREQRLAVDGGDVWLGLCDPCGLCDVPGWQLRNLLALAALWLSREVGSISAQSLRVLSLRDERTASQSTQAPPQSTSHASSSLLFEIILPAELLATLGADVVAVPPPSVGWEKNSNGRMGPRLMDLSSRLDPTALASEAAELNLRLMRWRSMPALEPARVAATKCLLLGAGTLGCAVARALLSWGVRKISFVDAGFVAYSNPVRQSLFEFGDCVGGRTFKAPAAAAALRRIHPSIDATGHVLSIPMPGHAVSAAETEGVHEATATLHALIKSHDAIFLLTDTRESRWLPTLIASSLGRLTVTAALGFDSLLVMRHGAAANLHREAQCATPCASPLRLGCYFCSDVVAPTNSVLRRTLDQQCTVSRPGLSMVASALAVELVVSLLHHPHGQVAAADATPADMELQEQEVAATMGGGGSLLRQSPLGTVPHQIRTSLPFWRVDCMTAHAFEHCTACGPVVIATYKKSGFEFLLRAFNDSSYLEDLTGRIKYSTRNFPCHW